uniref:Uncharacterized protein n=1 Tax=Triticum urartu TaxID=4572 RepID=A0A8R7UCQ5_TRIUA
MLAANLPFELLSPLRHTYLSVSTHSPHRRQLLDMLIHSWTSPLTPLKGILNRKNIFRVLGLYHELCSLLSMLQDAKLSVFAKKTKQKMKVKGNHQYNSTKTTTWNGHEMLRKLLKPTFLEQRYRVFTTDLHILCNQKKASSSM